MYPDKIFSELPRPPLRRAIVQKKADENDGDRGLMSRGEYSCMYNSNGEVPRPFLSIVLSKFVMTFNLLAMFVRTLILRRVKNRCNLSFYARLQINTFPRAMLNVFLVQQFDLRLRH